MIARAPDQPPLALRAEFPDALMDVSSSELWRHLSGPTLFDLPGGKGAPLAVSVMLQGSEHTGWRALQQVLKQFKGRKLPRPLLLYVGNAGGVRNATRTQPARHDHSRVWPGSPTACIPEVAPPLRKAVQKVAGRRPFASIDIHDSTGHDSTGRNPHYACVNRLDDASLHLARLYTRTVVYFERPPCAAPVALAEVCPTVTVECGRVGGEAGIAHAAEFLMAALQLARFPGEPVAQGDIDLLETVATVKVPEAATFSFDAGMADFRFREDIDEMNFAALKPGTTLGRLGPGTNYKLEVVPCGGNAADADYFAYDHGEIRLRRAAVPAMLTRDKETVRCDCLGYLMHPIGRDGRRLDG